MITYSIIKKSELEGAFRMDAEYYQPEYLRISNLIKNENQFVHLKQLKIKCDASAFYPALEPYYGQGDVPFIRVADVDDGIDYDNILTIPNEILNKYITLNLAKKGDIVITKGGSIARVGLVSKDSALTRDLIFFNTSKLDENDYIFYYVYCLTDFYKRQLIRSSSMTAQPHLTIISVRDIPLFNPSKDIKSKITEIFKESSELLEKSKSFYSEAENLLLEELGMGDYQHDSELFDIVNFLEIKSAERMDAEYFQPKYAKLEKKIKEHNAQRLGDLVTVKKGFEPGAEAYLEEGKLFIRVSSLTKLGIIDKDQKYLSESLYKELKKDYEPKVGEILLTKDASPGTAYVVKEPVEGIISGGIVRLKLKEQNIEPEYLALCISSIVGQAQAQRDAGGSVIMHWKPEQIKNLLVPILPRNVQKKISELVIQSHESRKKAKELLEEAKHKVEELIEKGV